MDTSVASVATQNHAAVVEVSVHINVGKIGYNSCRPSVETAWLYMYMCIHWLLLHSTYCYIHVHKIVLQTLCEMDKLTVEETRDLLMPVLFVLKHVDSSVLLYWWRECISSKPPHRLSEYEDPSSSHLSQLFDFFNVLEWVLYNIQYVCMYMTESESQWNFKKVFWVKMWNTTDWFNFQVTLKCWVWVHVYMYNIQFVLLTERSHLHVYSVGCF